MGLRHLLGVIAANLAQCQRHPWLCHPMLSEPTWTNLHHLNYFPHRQHKMVGFFQRGDAADGNEG